MKVHFFLRTLNEVSGGGSHYNAIAYIRALRRRGHEVSVHVFYNRGNQFPQDIVPEVHEGWALGVVGERDYLVELLRRYEPQADAYFLYGVDFIWAGGRYRRRGGKVPAGVYIDGYLSSMGLVHAASWRDTWYRYKRWVWDKMALADARHLDRFLPCSPYIGEVYKSFGFPKERFVVLPNIVPDAAEGIARSPQEAKSISILYVGRLTYDKGMDLLLDALARLKEYAWTLTVVGDGEMRPQVERAIAEGMPVEMAGWVPQPTVGGFYAKADIFVHPARWPDPAPRTIVDAISFGLPVVVPSTGGSSWIADGAGLVFASGDKEELYLALKKLLASETQRKEVGSRGPARAQGFREDKVAQQLEDILKHLGSPLA